jgi:hypothetical protein
MNSITFANNLSYLLTLPFIEHFISTFFSSLCFEGARRVFPSLDEGMFFSEGMGHYARIPPLIIYGKD